MSTLIEYESPAVGYVTLAITHYKPAVPAQTTGHPETRCPGEDAELEFKVYSVADDTQDPLDIHIAMEEEHNDILAQVERGEGYLV